jgi:hypothetical protein
LEAIVAELRGGGRPLPPLHWEIEFPEVFGRENPGFDAFVGNPPFLGGKRISTAFGDAYRDWLKEAHQESSSNADLSAHFFREAFALARETGTAGFVATNTIAQGDTRGTGLGWIRRHEGLIFEARRRVAWPGQAAVVVSVVHYRKRASVSPCRLDGKEVPTITAFLFHSGPDDKAACLAENGGISHVGVYILGAGFTFDDQTAGATSLNEMHRLIKEDPRNSELIHPYIGGSEVNADPRQRPNRFVIDFADRTLEAAAAWPNLLSIIEAKVRPERAHIKRPVYRDIWWKFGERQTSMLRAIMPLRRVLVVAQTSNSMAFAFQPTERVFAISLIVFAVDSDAFFCVMQSRVHASWAQFFASKMKDDTRYVPTDCFETFPLPLGWRRSASLEAIGLTYYDFRATLMIRNDEGLTKSYNRFHDPHERAPDILRLRELHAGMDRAVLDAYGWTDIPTDCDFFLDYEIDEETWGDKKKPYRYRWPDAVRDEVLARLLDLNQKRYQAEVAEGLHGGAAKKSPAPAKAAATVEPPRSPQATPQVVSRPAPADLLQLGTAELLALGTAEARRELKRRGRDPITGRKSAQEKLL